MLHQRASLWYEQHGVFPEAIRHALEAKDFERAARLLEGNGFEVVLRGQIKTALDWIGLLPESLVRARPLLCVLHASALVLINQVKEAEARLDLAEQGLGTIADQQTSRRIFGQIVLLRGALALSIGDAMRSCMLARQALELLPETEAWWYQVARTHAARAYLLEGDATPAAFRRVSENLEALSRSGDLVHTVACLLFLARLQHLQGQLREAVQTYRRVEQALSGRHAFDDMASASAYYFGLGEILYEWNRLEEAEQLFRQGVELDHRVAMVDARNVVQCSLGLARLLQARGDAAQALATLDDLLLLARHSGLIPHLIQRTAAIRAHIALAQGDIASALRWAEEADLSASDADLSYMREREYLTLARVLIVRGQDKREGGCLQEALHLLDRLLQEARARDRRHSSIEILVLHALTLHAQGDLEQALEAVRQALEWGEPEGYVRVFIDEGLPMTHLLLQLGEVFQQKAYVQTLLAVCAPARQEAAEQPFSRAVSVATVPALIEPLTERELEVLRLLAAGASNKAIAEQLVIEVSTAKRHVSNIFAKLMVTNRTLAVAKAREYGVLS
jgi:LuxR family transcriptional regulator, maltose regulon positive regulatory protein